MPDITHTLVAKGLQQRGERKWRTTLRAAISLSLSFACVALLILWVRSHTYRDRLVVPLSGSLFSRFDSEYGRIGIDFYGRNMGQMSFSASTLSHVAISEVWKRYSDIPEPGPGDHWLWDNSVTGRLSIHIPHWFLIALAAIAAGACWIPWRFGLRHLLVATAVLAVVLGFLVWKRDPTTKVEAPDPTMDTIKQAVEKTRSDAPDWSVSSQDAVVSASSSASIESLLTHIDSAVGDRIPMAGIDELKVAAYRYNGPIDKVLAIVATFAHKNGYSQDLGTTKDTAEAVRTALGNVPARVVDYTLFVHPNGDTLTVSRMAFDGTGTQILMVQFMESGGGDP